MMRVDLECLATSSETEQKAAGWVGTTGTLASASI